MLPNPESVDVCIASFRRPELLEKLLDSLALQKNVAEGPQVRVIVVDNDKTRSAEDVVRRFSARSHLPVIYDMEPQQNISLARNRSVRHSTADVIAFIDDDEVADIDWLRNLLNTLQAYAADAVFGPVIPVYSENAPRWVVEGRFFERKRHTTGAVLSGGRTGNGIVRRRWLDQYDKPFDPSLGLTGGEDTDLFLRLLSRGAKLVWCDAARVYEDVPLNRCTMRWLLQRAFRGGQTTARRAKANRQGIKKLKWLSYRLLLLMVAFGAVIATWYIHRTFAIQALQKLASNLGQLSALTPYSYEEYAAN